MNACYFTGREMTHPYTSSHFVQDYSLQELRNMSAELTQQEKQDPFYQYYSEQLAPLEETHYQTINGEMLPPAQGFMPQDVGKILLRHEENYPENGWTVLENGVGFASVLIHQTGITDEMIARYRDYFCHTENRRLFYKVWYPHMHMIHFEDGIVENFGWGFNRITMESDICKMKSFGISAEEISKMDPMCIGFLGLGGRRVELDDPEEKEYPMGMLQYTRLVPEGRELRVIYWNGLDFHADGTVSIEPSEDRTKTARQMKQMYTHCAQEYCNELKLIKTYYNDYLEKCS